MRRSQRLSSSGSKSRYFEDDVDESDDVVAPPKVSKRKLKAPRDDSSDDELQIDNEIEDSSEDGSQDDSEAVPPKKRGRLPKTNPRKRQADHNGVDSPRKKSRGRPAKATPIKAAKVKSDEEEEDDQDSDDEGPQVEFIPLPKLRDTGGIDYKPETVHPNTMAFLKDLKANNKRSWLKSRWHRKTHGGFTSLIHYSAGS
jgi:hypothetical protein